MGDDTLIENQAVQFQSVANPKQPFSMFVEYKWGFNRDKLVKIDLCPMASYDHGLWKHQQYRVKLNTTTYSLCMRPGYKNDIDMDAVPDWLQDYFMQDQEDYMALDFTDTPSQHFLKTALDAIHQLQYARQCTECEEAFSSTHSVCQKCLLIAENVTSNERCPLCFETMKGCPVTQQPCCNKLLHTSCRNKHRHAKSTQGMQPKCPFCLGNDYKRKCTVCCERYVRD